MAPAESLYMTINRSQFKMAAVYFYGDFYIKQYYLK